MSFEEEQVKVLGAVRRDANQVEGSGKNTELDEHKPGKKTASQGGKHLHKTPLVGEQLRLRNHPRPAWLWN